jgi:putative transposase
MARVRNVPQPPPRPPGGGPRRHFGPFDRIIMEGVAYRCVETNDDGHIFQAAHDEKVRKAVSHDDMPAEEDKAGYQHDRKWYGLGDLKARLHAGVACLTHLPSKERNRILFKFEWATEFMRLEEEDKTINRGDDSIKAAIPRIKAVLEERAAIAAANGRRKRAGRPQGEKVDVPGPKRLLEWVNMLVEADLNPLALQDNFSKSGNRNPKIRPEAVDLVDEFLDRYLVPREPSIRGLRIDMEVELLSRNEKRVAEGKAPLKLPSYEYIRQKVDDLPKFEVMACRKGIEKAMKKFRPVGEGIVDVYRPFQHCEMDHWNIQLHVICKLVGIWDEMTDAQKAAVEKARYVLGMVVCRRTRCIAALRLTRTATAQSAVELLEMAVTDKREYALGAGAVTPWDIYGTMGWLFADGGFANWEFKIALACLGINFEVPPAGLAHMRGMIERSFRMMHEGVVARFDGRTFQDIVRKGDYDSEGRAGNFVDELATALVRYAVDVHHNTPHPSLNYETPRECWIRLTKEVGVDPSPDWHKRRNVFGIDIKRTLGPAGLRFLNVQYRSQKLHEHFKQHGIIEMDVRVHELNMGAISAKIDETHWLTIPGPPEFERVTAKDWIAFEADQRRRGRTTAEVTAPIRLKAFADINKITDDGRRRIGIDDERTTAQQLLYAERQMTIGADYPAEGASSGASDSGGDLYDGALTVGQAAPAPDDLPDGSAAPGGSASPEDAADPPRRGTRAKGSWIFKE